MKNDFYIGWQPKAADYFSNKIKKAIVVFTILVVAISIALVVSQRGFVASNFEFGTLTTMEGALIFDPVPMLKTINENGEIQHVVLVDFGKKGAQDFISSVAAQHGDIWNDKWVKLEGTRIYHEGKMLLELSEGENAFKGVIEKKSFPEPYSQNFGEVSLMGEILDPKCAFGVMKPSEGKPHRSCAVRCIAGGIPPVFRMKNEAGESNYCLLLGENGEPINAHILDYVADQVRLCGRLVQQDDWLVLYADPHSDILRLQPHWMDGEVPLCSTANQ